MARFANELRDQVIQPTLQYLGTYSDPARNLLLNMGLLSTQFRCEDERLGVYCISPQQHREVWDDYLAFQPDLASEVRALASQRWFLDNPDREMIANLAYASAIAWIIFRTSGLELPAEHDIEGHARIWQRLFCPHIQVGPALDNAISWLYEALRQIDMLPVSGNVTTA